MLLPSHEHLSARFVIKGLDSQFVAGSSSKLYDISSKQNGEEAWNGIRYAKLILRAEHILLEGDSATVIG